MLTLYHIPKFRSSRVLWLYKELKAAGAVLPELKVHNFDPETFRTNKPDWYLKLNPNGKVPTLVDTFTTNASKNVKNSNAAESPPVVIWEGVACMNYLLRTYASNTSLSLNQLSPAKEGKYHQIACYCITTLDNLIATSSPIQRVLSDPKPGTNPETLDLNRKAWDTYVATIVSSFFDNNNTSNARSMYVLGDEFTAADVIFGYVIGGFHRKQPEWLQAYPQLLEYFTQRIATREAYKEASASVSGVVRDVAAADAARWGAALPDDPNFDFDFGGIVWCEKVELVKVIQREKKEKKLSINYTGDDTEII